MGAEPIDFNEEISRMFSGKKTELKPDDELALFIKHEFNICIDTMETMPALNEHIESLFLNKKK
jgi:hypothetical protein